MSCRNNLFNSLLLPMLVASTLILAACSSQSSNEPPQAGSDQFAINNGQSIDLPPDRLLANDSDPDGDPLRLVGVTTPAHGTLTPLPDGGYRYTNDGSNSTTDWFEYQVEDSKGNRATGTVSFSITPGPTAKDDHEQTSEDTPVTIDVAANDTSSDASITISSSDDATITIITPPARGTTEILAGKVQYVPENNFFGDDRFSYTIAIGGIPSNPATVTITVAPVNDPPQANDDTATSPEDTAVTILVLANDTDIDDGINPASVTILSGPANGSAVINDGKITYTPNNGFNGSDTLTYRLRDTGGLWSEPATVTITITPVNDGPPVAVSDAAVTGKNRPVTIDILANDSDPDGNGTIDRNAISITQPSHGSVTVNGTTGEITYTPDSGFSGSDSFTYRLRDEGGLWSNVAGVTVQVTNAAPVALGGCSTTRQEVPLTGMLGATDSDLGETLRFALGVDGSFGTGPMTTTNGGTVEITNDSTGAYTYTPKPSGGGRGKDTFVYQVTDGSGASATGTETVIVDLKIMPLGDSITSGETDVGNGGVPDIPLRTGYRKPLAIKLAANGYGFDFVGRLDHGCSAGYDANAEGWPGYTADQIAGSVTAPDIATCDGSLVSYNGILAALDQNPADIVLLHIGTNDIATTSASDIRAILDEIDIWESSQNGNHVTVVLAQIIDQWHWKSGDGHPNNVVNPQVTTLNNAIYDMVVGRSNDDIILVDMQSALIYPDDLGDRSRTDFHYWLHPNTNGYNKIADVWLYPLIGEGTNKIIHGANGPLLEKCN